MTRKAVVATPFLMGVKSETDISICKFRYSYVYEKRILRGIIRLKHEGIKTGQKLHNLYSSEYISRQIHWGHAACIMELKNANLCRIITGETETKGLLKSLDYIKMYLHDRVYVDVNLSTCCKA
jgi:hypothetical protein